MIDLNVIDITKYYINVDYCAREKLSSIKIGFMAGSGSMSAKAGVRGCQALFVVLAVVVR